MKSIPVTPRLDRLFDLEPQVWSRIAQASTTIEDGDYLHWDQLRHRTPPVGLSVEDWWYALKLKRNASRMQCVQLLAKDGRPLWFSRHGRIDASIARVDQALAGQLATNELAPNTATRDQYVASSLMEEAIHSSLFEGAASTRENAKEMLRSARAPINRDERMILNNFRAMQRIREIQHDPLSVERVLELHRILTDGTLDDPGQAGRIQRASDARIRIVDDRINRVVFDPPPAAQLKDRMEDLVVFANGPDFNGDSFLHPVLRSILLHFQLAYDHPFVDGNGRTARALFYWSMLRRGYWLAEYLSISRLLYRQRQPYERAYLFVESDEQDATYFILQQLEVLSRSIEELKTYIQRKSLAYRKLRVSLHQSDELNHRQRALLDHALRKPRARYTHQSHASSHRISIKTARQDLLELVERGWLVTKRISKHIEYSPVENLDVKLFGE